MADTVGMSILRALRSKGEIYLHAGDLCDFLEGIAHDHFGAQDLDAAETVVMLVDGLREDLKEL